MTTLAQLQSARAERDAARRNFKAIHAQVKADVDERGVGMRVADRATATATDIFVEAIEVVDNHRGIVAGTIAALVLWLFRNPIISAIRQVLGADATDQEDADHD